MEHVVELQPLPGERSIHRLSRHVIPVRAGLLVFKEEEPVVQSTQSEVADLVIDAWDQADPCVADDSEGHHPRLALQLSLRDVVVRHLLGQEGQTSVAARKKQDSGFLADLPLLKGVFERLHFCDGERVEPPDIIDDGSAWLEPQDSLHLPLTLRRAGHRQRSRRDELKVSDGT
jgi:hypothetical protein